MDYNNLHLRGRSVTQICNRRLEGIDGNMPNARECAMIGDNELAVT